MEIQLNDPEKPLVGIITGDTSVIQMVTHSYSIAQREGSTYSWEVDGGQFTSGQGSGAIEIQWGIENSIGVSLTEETLEGCLSDKVEIIVTIQPTGIETHSGNPIMVFPNPVVVLLTIQWDPGAQVSIFDAKGALIHQTTQKTIEFSNYTPGLYSIMVEDVYGNLLLRKKIVKLECEHSVSNSCTIPEAEVSTFCEKYRNSHKRL